MAADVERWPVILPHYRWVRFQDKQDFAKGIVEMAAWRSFLPGIKYPTWWVSEMRGDSAEPAVYYRHIRGITRNMDVKWSFRGIDDHTTHVTIVHDWRGPAWPLISTLAANLVIGPVFISAIARRTLAGVAREAERRTRELGRLRAAQ